jgi:CRISPR/Cas system-associated protein Cas7 (RAMP superfamily)
MSTNWKFNFTETEIIYRGKPAISGETLKKLHREIFEEIVNFYGDDKKLVSKKLGLFNDIYKIMDSLDNGQNLEFDVRDWFGYEAAIHSVVQFIMIVQNRCKRRIKPNVSALTRTLDTSFKFK